MIKISLMTKKDYLTLYCKPRYENVAFRVNQKYTVPYPWLSILYFPLCTSADVVRL